MLEAQSKIKNHVVFIFKIFQKPGIVHTCQKSEEIVTIYYQ